MLASCSVGPPEGGKIEGKRRGRAEEEERDPRSFRARPLSGARSLFLFDSRARSNIADGDEVRDDGKKRGCGGGAVVWSECASLFTRRGPRRGATTSDERRRRRRDEEKRRRRRAPLRTRTHTTDNAHHTDTLVLSLSFKQTNPRAHSATPSSDGARFLKLCANATDEFSLSLSLLPFVRVLILVLLASAAMPPT